MSQQAVTCAPAQVLSRRSTAMLGALGSSNVTLGRRVVELKCAVEVSLQEVPQVLEEGRLVAGERVDRLCLVGKQFI